jgi:hypothetical protein
VLLTLYREDRIFREYSEKLLRLWLSANL